MHTVRSIGLYSWLLGLGLASFACSLVVTSELDGKGPSVSETTDAGDAGAGDAKDGAPLTDAADTQDAADSAQDAVLDVYLDGHHDAAETGPAKRSTHGLVALYEFLDGSGVTVRDTSGFGTPLDLSLTWGGGSTWMLGGGLHIFNPTTIVSTDPASKIIQACAKSNSITVEVWANIESIDQKGPARFVSIGNGIGDQNMMVGQSFEKVEVRLKTSTFAPSLVSNETSLEPGLRHIVSLRSSDGSAQIFINGVSVADEERVGQFSSWDLSYRLAIANEVDEVRPWLGTLYLVAIYARALTKAEIDENHAAGLPKAGSSRLGQMLQPATESNCKN